MSHLKRISTLDNVLIRIIKYDHYFILSSGHGGEFWPVVQNSIGESVCLLWCHLFGKRSEDLHYSKFFNSDSVTLGGTEFSAENVKIKMLNELNMNDDEYKNFWEEVKDCRDKFIAHKEIGSEVTFPLIENCRIQAESLRSSLISFVRKVYATTKDKEWLVWEEYYNEAIINNVQLHTDCLEEFNRAVARVAKKLTKPSI